MSKKIFAAVIRWDKHQDQQVLERVEYFNQADIARNYGDGSEANAGLYATHFLLEDDEWLDDVLEEDAISDPAEIKGILGEALDYVRLMTENGADEREEELRQKLEKLLVSHVTIHDLPLE